MTNYFLKKPDNAIYGPVELDDLRDWAAEGRVAPGDMVSADRKTWHPAPSVRELSMRWVVEIGNGETVGPVHIEAIAELISQGQISNSALVRDVESDQVLTIDEAVAREEATPVTETKSGDPEREPIRKNADDTVDESAMATQKGEVRAEAEPEAKEETPQMGGKTRNFWNSVDQIIKKSPFKEGSAKTEPVDVESAASEDDESDTSEAADEPAADETVVQEFPQKPSDDLDAKLAELAEENQVLKEELVFVREEFAEREKSLREEIKDLKSTNDRLEDDIARLQERIKAMARWKEAEEAKQAEEGVLPPVAKPASLSEKLQTKVVQAAAARSKTDAIAAAREAAKVRLEKRQVLQHRRKNVSAIRRGPTSRF